MARKGKIETAVYLSPEVHEALRVQKDRTGKSMSELVEAAVKRHYLADKAELWPELEYVMRQLEELRSLCLFHMQLTLYHLDSALKIVFNLLFHHYTSSLW